MAKGILARKLGMTQLYDENGKSVPVTILEAGPCTVVQVKTQQTDRYNAVQLAFDPIRPKLLTKPRLHHFTKKELSPFRVLREIRDPEMELTQGQVLKADIFAAGDIVKATGISKGKGFQGVMKRHGFGGGRASHGSAFHRAPGSIGAHTFPAKVWKGKKLPGHGGCLQTTTINLKVMRVDAEKNLILVKGAVPGPRTSFVKIEAMKR